MNLPLRHILYLDFAGGLSTALVMLAFATPLEVHVGFSAGTLRIAAVALLPFVAFVLHTARQDDVLEGRVRGIIAFNALWFVASFAWIFIANLTSFGNALLTAQALLIVPLVWLEGRAIAQKLAAPEVL